MKWIQSAALASLFCCIPASASEAINSFQAVIADKDHRLFLYSNSTEIMDLTSYCQCAYVDEASVRIQQKKGQNYYLVLSMSGPSKAQMDMHYCGAGTEANLVWLKLDKQFKLLSSSNHLVDSCFKSVEITRTLEYTDGNGKMQGSFVSYHEMKAYEMSYDTAAPEKGIGITSKPIN